MAKYAALLRGIGPSNPKMSNENLRLITEGLGYKEVQTVISSGNIIFSSRDDNIKSMQAKMEAAWPRELGFKSTTIIKGQKQLESLVKSNPFGDLEHGRKSYLLTTFFKHPIKVNFNFPHELPQQSTKLIAFKDNVLFSVTDTLKGSSLDLMAWMEKQFGKEITSRTWLTIHRILKKME